MGNIKEINIKNQTYYFFVDMINIENFDPSLLKANKKLYQNIDIYCIGYITMKDSGYVKTNSVNPLHLIVDKVDGSIKRLLVHKYLILASTDKNNEVLIKYAELWNEIKSLIKCNFFKAGKYRKDFIKIKFNSDDKLLLNKI